MKGKPQKKPRIILGTTINKRLIALEATFGLDSPVVKAAYSYIKHHASEDELKFIKGGKIRIADVNAKGERITKATIFGRHQDVDEYIPTINKLFKREAANLQKLVQQRAEEGTILANKSSKDAIKENTYMKMLEAKNAEKLAKDPKLAKALKKSAEKTAEDLEDYDEVADALYSIAKDPNNPNKDEDMKLWLRRTKTREWIEEAKAALARFDDYMANKEEEMQKENPHQKTETLKEFEAFTDEGYDEF